MTVLGESGCGEKGVVCLGKDCGRYGQVRQ